MFLKDEVLKICVRKLTTHSYPISLECLFPSLLQKPKNLSVQRNIQILGLDSICQDSLSHFLIVGCFKPGENGTILKKSTDKERECLVKLMKDILRPYIPEYKKEVNKGGERILGITKNISFIFLICHVLCYLYNQVIKPCPNGNVCWPIMIKLINNRWGWELVPRRMVGLRAKESSVRVSISGNPVSSNHHLAPSHCLILQWKWIDTYEDGREREG